MRESNEQRFLKSFIIDNETGCWIWQKANKRYGVFRTSNPRKQVSAHRYSYVLHKGEITENMFVCHTCDNPICVNPEHLFLGTHMDNVNDMISKKRHVFGIKHGNSKLSEQDVLEIKKAFDTPYWGIGKDLSKKYNIDNRTISCIKLNKNWKHV